MRQAAGSHKGALPGLRTLHRCHDNKNPRPLCQAGSLQALRCEASGQWKNMVRGMFQNDDRV